MQHYEPHVAIRTGDSQLDGLATAAIGALRSRVSRIDFDGGDRAAYHPPDARETTIRDIAEMARGFRYADAAPIDALRPFTETQARNGRIFDAYEVDADGRPSWFHRSRVSPAAECHLVRAVHTAWQATGDHDWMRRTLGALERALHFAVTHRERWSASLGLLTRPLTLEPGDTVLGETAARAPAVDDNTACVEAFRAMAGFYRHLGSMDAAAGWTARADLLQANVVGRFVTDTGLAVFVDPPEAIASALDDPDAYVSGSSLAAVNRGGLPPATSAAIVRAFAHRATETDAFAPWFVIDPPLPDALVPADSGCDNDALSIGIGAELAVAALRNGEERYGVHTLRTIADHAARVGALGDGLDRSGASHSTRRTRSAIGDGPTAVLWALVEGLAGIRDTGCCLETVELAPRWCAADLREVEVTCGYPASGRQVQYRYAVDEAELTIQLTAPTETIDLHVLLPTGFDCIGLRVDGDKASFERSTVGESTYVDGTIEVHDTVEIKLELLPDQCP